MGVRNVPLRSGRIRGHRARPSSRAAQLLVEEIHRAPAGKVRRTLREAAAAAMGRLRREAVRFKPASMGRQGRLALQSPSTRRANLRNAKRKPAVRGRTGKPAR